MIIKKFQEQVIATPGNIAIKTEDRIITYSELNAFGNQLAQAIVTHEFNIKSSRDQQRISLLFDHGPDMIIALIGVLKAGKTYIPLDSTYPEKRLSYMLQDSDSNLILTDTANASLAHRLIEQYGHKVDVININRINLKSTAAAHIEFETPGDENKVAYILYTSGSTGEPKGVMQTHRNVLYYIRHWIQRYSITETDRLTFITSFSHDQSVQDIFAALLSGACLYTFSLRSSLNTFELANLLLKEKITIWHSVPSVFRFFTNDLPKSNYFNDMRWLLIGGEALRAHDLELFKTHFPKARVGVIYGQTEASFNSTCIISPEDTFNDVSLGTPLEGTRLLVVNDEGNIVEKMGAGEIVVASDYLSPGYWKDHEKTQKVFDFDDDLGRIFWTGDLGRLTAAGTIKIMGRKDFQLKIRGFRVEPGEIETLLLRHPVVKEAVIIAKNDENNDNYLCAYIVSRENISSAQLREYLSLELPTYMVPRYFVYLEEMPVTPNGKIDRQRLPEPDAEMVSKSVYVPPTNETERKLAAIWQEVLGVEKVGIYDNFIELGGHSLLVISIVSKIHLEFNVELRLNDVFNNPTVKELARLILNSELSSISSIRSSEKKDYYALSSAQKRFFILQQMDFQSSAYNNPLIFQLHGKLNKQRFDDAFHQLIHRHESLRTAIIMIDDVPAQRIHDLVEFEIEYFSAAGEPVSTEVLFEQVLETPGKSPGKEDNKTNSFSKSQERRAKSYIKNFIRPFDLSQAPLIRVGLIEIEEEKHLLMVDMHHIVSDGTSMNLLTREFITMYTHEELLPLRLQYKDYCEWQHHLLASGQLKKQENYWMDCFSGALPVLQMPTDFPRPAVQQFEGDGIAFYFEEELSQSLIHLARETGTTLFIVLLAVYNILLSKYTGQRDIIIGTPTAGRNHPDLAVIIGLLIETLAIRNYPEEDKTFEEFLEEVKENALNAYENQVYPFGELIKNLGDEKDRSRNPLFDAMLIVQNIDPIANVEESRLAELKLIPYQPDSYKISKIDLTLVAAEGEDKIFFALEYCTKLFKKETMQRLISSFKKIVAAITHNRTIKLGEIRISHDLLTAVSSREYEGVESEFGF